MKLRIFLILFLFFSLVNLRFAKASRLGCLQEELTRAISSKYANLKDYLDKLNLEFKTPQRVKEFDLDEFNSLKKKYAENSNLIEMNTSEQILAGIETLTNKEVSGFTNLEKAFLSNNVGDKRKLNKVLSYFKPGEGIEGPNKAKVMELLYELKHGVDIEWDGVYKFRNEEYLKDLFTKRVEMTAAKQGIMKFFTENESLSRQASFKTFFKDIFQRDSMKYLVNIGLNADLIKIVPPIGLRKYRWTNLTGDDVLYLLDHGIDESVDYLFKKNKGRISKRVLYEGARQTIERMKKYIWAAYLYWLWKDKKHPTRQLVEDKVEIFEHWIEKDSTVEYKNEVDTVIKSMNEEQRKIFNEFKSQK